MNQKARHISKRKAGSSARKRLRKLHTSEYENSCFTKKIVLYFKEETIDSKILQSAVPSLTSRERTAQAASSKKKKKTSRKKRKGKGKRRRESAKGGEKEKEKEKKDEKGKEEMKKEE